MTPLSARVTAPCTAAACDNQAALVYRRMRARPLITESELVTLERAKYSGPGEPLPESRGVER